MLVLFTYCSVFQRPTLSVRAGAQSKLRLPEITGRILASNSALSAT